MELGEDEEGRETEDGGKNRQADRRLRVAGGASEMIAFKRGLGLLAGAENGDDPVGAGDGRMLRGRTLATEVLDTRWRLAVGPWKRLGWTGLDGARWGFDWAASVISANDGARQAHLNHPPMAGAAPVAPCAMLLRYLDGLDGPAYLAGQSVSLRLDYLLIAAPPAQLERTIKDYGTGLMRRASPRDQLRGANMLVILSMFASQVETGKLWEMWKGAARLGHPVTGSLARCQARTLLLIKLDTHCSVTPVSAGCFATAAHGICLSRITERLVLGWAPRSVHLSCQAQAQASSPRAAKQNDRRVGSTRLVGENSTPGTWGRWHCIAYRLRPPRPMFRPPSKKHFNHASPRQDAAVEAL
ncbi:hypothetical protein B0T10DRAFT_550345 [Thelonectria olida]|uniref:Uncharacterized protein n=1 Tax=Thelonectria olida TaxID=1576542 RepID=A0A9P8VZ81_9HYPO|nr:hypothetical protein B0T10DRAFT_550345 [Thelonectria olida]